MTRRSFLAVFTACALLSGIVVAAIAWRSRRPSLNALPTSPLTSGQLALLDSAGMDIGFSAAPVLIRVIGDYECEACRRLDEVAGRAIRRLSAERKVRYSYVHAPLTVHRRGAEAAAAAYCARDQDRTWAFHELLYEHAGNWAVGEPAAIRFTEYSGQLGLDSAAFSACLRAPTTLARVARDARAGRSLAQRHVPVVVIDDRIIAGVSPQALLQLVHARLGQTDDRPMPRLPSPGETEIPLVSAESARRGDLIVSIEATGTVAAWRTAIVTAQLAARVDRLEAREGDLVRAGDRIASLDPEAARLSLRDAELRRDQARLIYDETTLFDDRIQDSAVRAERADRARLRSGLSAAEVALAKARLDFSNTEITAPFAGVITRLHLEPGVLARPGQEFVEIAALDTLRVEVQVLEADLHRVRIGARAAMRMAGHAGDTLTGRVIRIPRTVEQATRRGTVLVQIDTPRTLLRPGMFVTAAIEVECHPNQLIVPRSALTERDSRAVLFTVPQGLEIARVKWRYVDVQAVNDSSAAVRVRQDDPPLVGNERVLTSGHSALAHDALVRVVDRSST